MDSTIAPLTPRQIVAELDNHIIGQSDAKKLVAIALRNRYRRAKLHKELADEILPKNILMMGPTGCGKTEIARRLAKLVGAPFVKIEATRYTEVGYVGRDVESIIRDLLEVAIKNERQKREVSTKPKAEQKVVERLLKALIGKDAKGETREQYKKKLLSHQLDDTEITIEFTAAPKNNNTMMEIPGANAGIGMIQISDAVEGMMGKMFKQKQEKTMSVKRAREELLAEEMDKLLDHDEIIKVAMDNVEQNGIVFIDEFDKICVRDSNARQDISREGVQRDLLPMIEGATIATRHGMVKTDYILFIASGAFHLSKPADLLPELQGRLPIRVRLSPLTRDDFINILTQTRHNLLEQYQHLLAVDGVELQFAEGAINKMADLAMAINAAVENIGARRLHTLIEKLLENISFEADGSTTTTIAISEDMVDECLSPLVEDQNLQKFIL
ncbi:MAG: ATP-dependent protease ATPase subunit HslU [Alphaproteobacteria bacterium]